MTVTGMSTSPANARDRAPVAKFAVLLIWGRLLLLLLLFFALPPPLTPLLRVSMEAEDATYPLNRFNVLKYSALPNPVRMTLGKVPRHRPRKPAASGPERMARTVGRRVVERDCWRRVLSRSAGWRRVAERTPVERPARKWKAGAVSFVNILGGG